jgi:hypothetical protein
MRGTRPDALAPSSRGAYPALTVSWEGTLKAIVGDDGTIAGTVEGTFSNSEGSSKPFQWEFVGDPVEEAVST